MHIFSGSLAMQISPGLQNFEIVHSFCSFITNYSMTLPRFLHQLYRTASQELDTCAHTLRVWAGSVCEIQVSVVAFLYMKSAHTQAHTRTHATMVPCTHAPNAPAHPHMCTGVSCAHRHARARALSHTPTHSRARLNDGRKSCMVE